MYNYHHSFNFGLGVNVSLLSMVRISLGYSLVLNVRGGSLQQMNINIFKCKPYNSVFCSGDSPRV